MTPIQLLAFFILEATLLIGLPVLIWWLAAIFRWGRFRNPNQ